MKLLNVFQDCLGDPKWLQMPQLWDTCQGELLTGSRTNIRERSILQSTKLKGVGYLKDILTIDMEMQNLEVCSTGQFCFGTVFSHYAPFPTFWICMYM